ncbi:signal peptidase I [Kitasatospora sp. NPDC017646]|uniref:signal peptidase I n=1 Tax=Kitasatospora sp. NPDC017646 TaxID=3364024 RepID=UPI0037B10FB8
MSVQQSTESGESGGTEGRPTTGPGGTGPGGDQPAAGQEAAAESAKTPETGAKPARRKRPFWQELPILLVIALLLSLGIKTFFVQAFSIPSGSMENTLQIGDRVLVDKFTPWFGAEPERGEVVVFHDPGGWLEETAPKNDGFMGGVQKVLSTVGLMPSADEKDLIKRVIAVGGDTVECNAGSPVKVNGVALDEPYLFPGATPCDNDPVGTVTVPEGKLWVMGDHRNNSRDSRPHHNLTGDGFVPVDDVVGRAFVVAWPISNWSTLPVPDTFDEVPSHAAGTLPEQAPPAPAALALAGVVPIALWRRRRSRRRTG